MSELQDIFLGDVAAGLKGDSAKVVGEKLNAWLAALRAGFPSARLNGASANLSFSLRDDGAGNLGLFVGPAGAADGAQVLVATVDKATGNIGFGGTPAASDRLLARKDQDAFTRLLVQNLHAGANAGNFLALNNGSAEAGLFQKGNGTPDANTVYLYNSASAPFVFSNGSERMRIDASGDVGIGTMAPAGLGPGTRTVEISAASIAMLRLSTGEIVSDIFAGDSQLAMINRGPQPMTFWTNAIERMRITSVGHILFGADGTQNLGGPSNRGATAYFTTGAINTSDAREKTPVRELTEAERAAARDLRAEIGVFQWLDAIAEKGEAGARLHIGLTVQRAIEIMESHGLDPWRYGFICRDEVTRRVTVMQTQMVRATETVEEPFNEIEVRDGVPVLVRKTRTVERKLFEMRPVLDEAGVPVMQTISSIVGEHGELLEQEPAPLMHPVPIMIERDVEVEIDEPAGERLGFRPDQLALFMLAGLADV